MVLIEAYASWNSFTPDLVICTKAGGEITLTMGAVIDAEREDLDPLSDALNAYYGVTGWSNDGKAIRSMPHHCEDGEWISGLDFTISTK